MPRTPDTERSFRRRCAGMLACALLLAGCQAPPGFIEGRTVGIVTQSPSQFPLIFLNTYTGVGVEQFRENHWSTVDASRFIPPDAKAVYVSGLLIITHGNAGELCDLTLAYRASGEAADFPYVAQTIETTSEGGQRTPHSIWVPVRGGTFEIKWTRSTAGNWPEHCAYGVNLGLVGYLR